MEIKRILLIIPPAITLKYSRDINPLPPLGLGYLAAVTENMGIQTKLADFLMLGWHHEEEIGADFIRIGSPDEEITALIKEFSPDLVGVSCQFSRQNKLYHHIFSLIKQAKPECIIVAGGAHVTVCPEEVINNAGCNYILMGEAEKSFGELVATLIKDEDISFIDGLGWKSQGKIHINQKKKWVTDLDSLPFPAYHLMDIDKYAGLNVSHGARHRKRFFPIITSRGCPAKCTFCSAKEVWGDKYRIRSVSNVLREMKKLKEEYNIEELMFEDDNVTADGERAKELFAGMIREKLGFVWDTPNGVGVWSLDESMLELIKESGCVRLNFPIESGSQHVIDLLIRKPIRLARARLLIEHCRKIKLDYGIFLVIGIPGEKIADIWKTFSFAAKCKCFTPHISVATPYPGTELFQNCLRNNYFSRAFSLDDLFIRSFMIKTPEWDENKLRRVLFWGEFYLKLRHFIADPFYIMKRIVQYATYPKLLKNYFRRITYRK